MKKRTILIILVIASMMLCSCLNEKGNVRVSLPDSGSKIATSETSVTTATQPNQTESTKATPIRNQDLDSFLYPDLSNAGERAGIAPIVAKISSSAVAINVTGTATDYFSRVYPTEGSGSGVIISDNGYIVTNNHVVTGGDTITVFLSNGEKYTAKLVGADVETDIAVLKIDAPSLSPAIMGESSTLRVGDYAIAVGNPIGELQGTVTMGIISALDREISLDGKTLSMFQTDAAVSPGNSGGGLFDSNGTLIGIVTAKSSDTNVEGIGFVIPIDSAKVIISDLIEYGYVKGRPFLGFSTTDITSRYQATINRVSWIGVYIDNVVEGSLAEKSGVLFRDYINKVDGEEITTTDRLNEILNTKEIGDNLILEIWRDDKKMDIVVTVEEKKD